MLGAMVQEHERGLGGWQAEWDTLPDLVLVSAGGARAVADALDSLSVDTDRMRVNVDASGGTLLAESIAMALAESLGKSEAHACVEAACRRAVDEGRPFADVLGDDPVVARHLDRTEIARLAGPPSVLSRGYSPGQKIWEYPLGGAAGQVVPAIGADGTIYMGSWNSKVFALNPDGTKQWEFETGDNVTSSPAIGVGGTVYVGSVDNRVYALNLDGSKQWEFTESHQKWYSNK